MKDVIKAARVLFVLISAVVTVCGVYVILNRDAVSGSNALAILGACVACIGVIASWRE